MNTRFAVLALALVTLGTACDPEAAPSPTDAMFRDGEVIVPPTGPIGTGLVVKGGHDNPTDVLYQGYDLAAAQYQDAFDDEVELEAHDVIADQFLANERNYAACPGICEELEMGWEGGVYIGNLEVAYDDVLTVSDRQGNLYWQTSVEALADVGCGCI